MIGLPPGTKVFLACQPIDLRAGFDGLAAKVQQIIGADPFSGHVFIFRSKRGHYLKGLYWISKACTGSQSPVLDLKGLYWDGSGLCLFAKRLERHKFVWPPIVEGTLTLTPAQLALLVEAMDWRRTIAPPPAPRPMLV
jgi:transposase